ncbi:phage head-tail connector protein [Enterococcus thailandicus]|uniref:phage head-tail connector protein n=1 Tax=Enterococcus TaxID=1350 RepID=UPI0022E4FC3E|nr:phage head-tail connector protein [Enterococcus thailandicus]MDK4352679.1 phage head-tail connector protein [Enterococcus thailandicus]MDT2735407.1 phage head-tail connector protein [Enterococcus thailandicus]
MDEEKLVKASERLAKDLGLETDDVAGLVEDAVILVLDYTNRDEMMDSLWVYVRQLATISYNQESNEGEVSRSEGGISQSFLTDIPESIQRGLNRYRLGKVVNFYASKET